MICALKDGAASLLGSESGEPLGVLGVASGWRWGVGLLNLLLASAGVVLGSGYDQKLLA